jgi:GNAT superfamily N-acetyltransferase
LRDISKILTFKRSAYRMQLSLAYLFGTPNRSPVVGGAFGWTWGAACYIRYLFLPTKMRKQGLGTMLMRAVEKEAKSRGSRQIVLETHEFQAPEFYQKPGFKIVSRVADHPRGHEYLTLVSILPEETSRYASGHLR